jgi:hypothetical protein
MADAGTQNVILQSSGKRPARARGVRFAIVFVAGICTVIVVAGVLALTTPRGYSPSDGTDPGVRTRGEALENAAWTQISAVRQAASRADNGTSAETRATAGDSGTHAKYLSEPWSVAISASDANAWLATRLIDWMSSRGVTLPSGVGQTCVTFGQDEITLHLPYETAAGRTILTLPLRGEVTRSGALELRPGTAWAGLLPMPGGTTAGIMLLRSAVGTHVEAGAPADRLVIAQPIIDVGDGRRVRLLAFSPRNGRVELTFQTQGK